MTKIPDSARLRVIVDGVGIYCKRSQIPSIFATTRHHYAAEWAIQQIEASRNMPDMRSCMGFAGRHFSQRFAPVDVQVDLL